MRALVGSTPVKRIVVVVIGLLCYQILAQAETGSADLVSPETFTDGIEGPAFDSEGNLYVVNYLKQGTVGKIDKQGHVSLHISLPDSSVGNGIQFGQGDVMYIADYVNHKIWKKSPDQENVSVYSHQPEMNQPNDLAMMNNGILFASDPDWATGKGQVWRIETDGSTVLLESDMGTTNGIAVSEDEQFLYVNESVQRKVWRFKLATDGTVSEKTLFFEFDDFGLDGMRCDSNGNLYIARYGAGEVAVLNRDAKLVMRIPLKGKFPTNVALLEGESTRLYVTMQKRRTIEVVQLPSLAAGR